MVKDMENGKSKQERYFELMLLNELVNSKFVTDKEIFIDQIQQLAAEVRKDIMIEQAQHNQERKRDAFEQSLYNDNIIEQLRALGIKTNEDTGKDLDSHAIR